MCIPPASWRTGVAIAVRRYSTRFRKEDEAQEKKKYTTPAGQP